MVLVVFDALEETLLQSNNHSVIKPADKVDLSFKANSRMKELTYYRSMGQMACMEPTDISLVSSNDVYVEKMRGLLMKPFCAPKHYYAITSRDHFFEHW